MPLGTRSKLNLVRREDFVIPVKKRKTIKEICKDQAHTSKFAFVHDGHPNDFAMSQWPIGIYTYFFYRLCLVIFFFVGIIIEISHSAKHGGLQAKWLIEVYNWDVILLLTYVAVALAINIKFQTTRTNIRPIKGIPTQCHLTYYDSNATSLGFQDDRMSISRIEEEQSQDNTPEVETTSIQCDKSAKSKTQATSNSGSEESEKTVKTRKEISEVTFVQGDIGLPPEPECKTSKVSRTSILKPMTSNVSNKVMNKAETKLNKKESPEDSIHRGSISSNKRKYSYPVTCLVGTPSEIRPISWATSGGTDIMRVPLKPLPWYIKLHWLLFSISANSALMNTFLHWTVFTAEHNHGDRIHVDFFKHIMNAIVMTVDIILVNFPLNYLHFWHTTVYFSCYGIFAATYSLVGGSDAYINEYLNFNDSAFLSIIYILVFVFLFVPTVQLFCFSMYIVRMVLYKLYRERTDKSKPSVTS